MEKRLIISLSPLLKLQCFPPPHFLVYSACLSLVWCTTNIFSLFGCYFLKLLMISFAVTRLLNLMLSHFSVFTIIDYWTISTLFSYRSFLGRGLRFRPLVCFEFIYMVKEWDAVSFLCIQTSNLVPLTEKTIFAQNLFLHNFIWTWLIVWVCCSLPLSVLCRNHLGFVVFYLLCPGNLNKDWYMSSKYWMTEL